MARPQMLHGRPPTAFVFGASFRSAFRNFKSVSKLSARQISRSCLATNSLTSVMVTDTRTALSTRLQETLVQLYADDAPPDPKLTPATNPRFGDYQCNAALALSKKLQQKADAGVRINGRDVANAILAALDVSELCEKPAVAGPGFINLTLSDDYVIGKLKRMYADRERLGIPIREKTQRVIVDFSSPNIAKDMHVGHLRSTIIGDTLSRILEFLGHETIRLNHTGDWGTQFGQLITYVKRECPQLLQGAGDAAAEIGDLVEFYKKAKKRFDEDDEFKESALAEVVELQSGNPESLAAWKMICEISRAEFEKVYKRLDIKLTERGESFYNPFLKGIIELLTEQELAVENEGATVVFLEGNQFTKPVIVRKSDGGFLYATTDLAAVQYRVNEDKADRIIYVTDVGQSLHFQEIFAVARKARILPDSVRAEHVAFGLVQGADGKKFKTRSGAAPKLAELLDEARDRVRNELERRAQTEAEAALAAGQDPPLGKSEEEMERISELIGIAAVKYADLKNNRTNNYKFSFDKMVKLEGDTAPYVMYAFARVQGIYRTAAAQAIGDGKSLPTEIEFSFAKNEERALAKTLLRLPEVLSALESDLLPNVLCEYVYGLTAKFNQFYEQCPVLNAETETLKGSRLALCQISADTLKLCLNLLGIPTLDRI